MTVYVKVRCPCCGDEHEVPLPVGPRLPSRCFFCRQDCAAPWGKPLHYGTCKKPRAL